MHYFSLENSARLCTADDIKNLNETKQYSLISTDLINFINTDPNLIASAAKLWKFLYTKATFTEDLSVIISIRELSNVFKCCKRTVQRYINNLKEFHYLEVKNNFNYRGQQASTFFIRFPGLVIQSLQSKNDRVRAYKNDNIIANPIENESTNDNNVTPRNDNNVAPIEVISQNTINNNNVVYNKNIEIEKLSTEISLEKEKLFILEKKYLKTKEIWLNNPNNYEVHRELSSLEHNLIIKKQKIELIKRKLNHENLNENNFCSENFVKNIDGPRKLSDFEFRRLKKGVSEMNLEMSNHNRLINEVIFAIRFGNLTKCNINKKEISIMHSISIALKLIREGRWETPSTISEIYSYKNIVNK